MSTAQPPSAPAASTPGPFLGGRVLADCAASGRGGSGTMAETSIKGVSFIHMNEFLRLQFGEDGFKKVMGAISPDAAKVLDSPYGHEWYPFRHIVEIERTLADTFYAGDYSKLAEFGHFDGLRQVGKVYRFLLRMLEPSFLIKQGNKMWRSYMNGGDLQCEIPGPKQFIARLTGYDPLHVAHCWENVGSFRASMEVCGAKQTQVEHTECRLKGAPACVYLGKW
jgi:hypothetical protein